MQNAMQVRGPESGGHEGLEGEARQYLTFLLGREMFAIPILNIKEIIEYANVTTVPMMPKFIRGVINLRGAVVPVIDLAARFGREVRAASRRTCIVIIEMQAGGEAHDVGVVVDSVSAVLSVEDDDVEPPPSFGAHINTDFIHGMGRIDGELVIILDVERVLAVEEMAMLVEMKAGVAGEGRETPVQ